MVTISEVTVVSVVWLHIEVEVEVECVTITELVHELREVLVDEVLLVLVREVVLVTPHTEMRVERDIILHDEVDEVLVERDVEQVALVTTMVERDDVDVLLIFQGPLLSMLHDEVEEVVLVEVTLNDEVVVDATELHDVLLQRTEADEVEVDVLLIAVVVWLEVMVVNEYLLLGILATVSSTLHEELNIYVTDIVSTVLHQMELFVFHSLYI